MHTFQFSVRLSPQMTEEVMRLAKANGKSAADMIRQLVQDSLIRRAEDTTDTQFHLVEKRLARMEERFVAWMIKLSKASSKGLFFTEQLALYEVDEAEQQLLQNAANAYVRRFLQKSSSVDEEHTDGK